MKIYNEISIHHLGGIRDNPYLSTLDFTAEQLNLAHKAEWEFKSLYTGKYGGYNFFCDKNGKITQFRAIGEETAAVKRRNKDVLSFAFAGNFNKFNGQSVDQPTLLQLVAYKNFIIKLFEKEYSGWIILPNTEVQLTISGINPHRFYTQTECYGNSLDNEFCRKDLRIYLNEKITLIQKLISLYQKLILILYPQKLEGISLTSCYLQDNRN